MIVLDHQNNYIGSSWLLEYEKKLLEYENLLQHYHHLRNYFQLCI